MIMNSDWVSVLLVWLLARFRRKLWFHPLDTTNWTGSFSFQVGNEAPTAYVPEPFLGHPYGMNFYERLTNFLYARASELNHKMSYLPRQDALMRKYFGNDHPYVEDIIRNMSALFINDHVSTSFPRPWVQNMVGIGGVHILKPKPLPAVSFTMKNHGKL